MIIVFTYNKRHSIALQAPEECLNTSAAMDWAIQSIYGRNAGAIYILDMESYFLDLKIRNKRSPIDQYILLSKVEYGILYHGVYTSATANPEIIETLGETLLIPLFPELHCLEANEPLKSFEATEAIESILNEMIYES